MKLLRHPASCKVAAIVAAGLVVGCLGSSPNVRLYTMNVASDSLATSAPDGLAIGVGPIRVPRYLDRPEWVTRPGGSTPRLEVDDSRRWAGGFSSNILSALSGTLNAEMMPSLIATLKEAESALASADSLIAPDADASLELKRLLFELADAAQAIRRLAEQLEQHPESLIQGKKGAGR